jgi:hypothetical protein
MTSSQQRRQLSRRLILAAALVTAVTITVGDAPATDVQPVEVINLPEIQQVDGTVGVDGPIPSARMERFTDVLVAPVLRSTTSRLVEAGTLTTDGFTTLLLSLAVEIKGTVTNAGTIGVMLVPDEPLVVETLRSDGVVLLPVELTTDAAVGAEGWLTAGPIEVELAFPAYRVLLFNGSDKSVSANLFAYLRSS